MSIYDRLSDPESLKEREAVHTSCRKVYQENRRVGGPVSTSVKAQTLASDHGKKRRRMYT